MEKTNFHPVKQQHQHQQRLHKVDDAPLTGFSPVSAPRIFWRSRKRSGDSANEMPINKDETPDQEMEQRQTPEPVLLTERRKSLFEPLEPNNGKRKSAESLLPPPDFDSTAYPKGWLIGKKRKLVNVDVVESMRRIAVQEINRKDREIDGLNEQLEEDARCLEHLQLQLLEERSKRSEVERENGMLQEQINMLMNMLQENETMGDEGADEP
ncbi:hypothetical protein AB3S75_003262 [Citrus x aurantiifolia]